MTEQTSNKKPSTSAAGVFAVVALVVAATLLFGAMADNRGASSPPAKPGSDSERAAAKAETMRGGTVKDAHWSTDTTFWITLLDDGSRRDGYAQAVCEIVRQNGVRGSVTVTAWEAYAMTRGEFKELGKARCR